MKKKFLSVSLLAVLLALTSCGGNKDDGSVTVHLLNFKPEIDDKWDNIKAGVKKDLGINLVVDSAANGQYDNVLRSKISTADSPAIFQINGPVGYANWEDNIADLDDIPVVKKLNSGMALTIDNHIKAIPVTVEGYGIIYNKALTDRYFALSTRSTATGVSSMDEVNSYTKLKAVVEDMGAHKAELGIDGVFSPSGLDSSTSWRITGHAFDMPLVAELGSSTTATPATFNFTGADNYRNLLDLYVKNSTMSGNDMVKSTWTGEADLFAKEKTVMVQNGQWATGDLTAGGKVKAENLRFLPLYCGDSANFTEATQGINIGTESYWVINKKLDASVQDAAAKVLEWMFDGAGKTFVKNDLSFLAPFSGFNTDDLAPEDPLIKETVKWMNDSTKVSVPWDFTLVPSTDDQRADLVNSLTKYYNNDFSDAAWTELVNNTKTKWTQLVNQTK